MALADVIGSSVSGRAFKGPHSPTTTFPPGRTCAELECETILSIYNESVYCALHQPEPVGGCDGVRGTRSSQRSVA